MSGKQVFGPFFPDFVTVMYFLTLKSIQQHHCVSFVMGHFNHEKRSGGSFR